MTSPTQEPMTAQDDQNPMDRPMSRKEFDALTLGDLQRLSGVQAPELPASVEEVEAFREQAWLSYQQDIANRDELGGIDRSDEPLSTTAA